MRDMPRQRSVALSRRRSERRSSIHRRLLSVVCLTHAVIWLSCAQCTTGLVVSAPAACGGTRVATHASAFFNPTGGSSKVLNAPLYAPMPDLTSSEHVPSAAHNAMSQAVIVTTHSNLAKGRDATHSYGQARQPSTNDYKLEMLRLAEESHDEDQDQNEGSDERSSRLRSWSLVPRTFQRLSRVVNYRMKRSRRARRKTNALHSSKGTSAYAANPITPTRHDDPAAGSLETDKIRKLSETNLALIDACEAIPGTANQRAQGRVAVVTRGRCDFTEKVLRMQRAGALGVVVVNYKDADQLVNMKRNESKVTPEPIRIPAVMISFKDWAVFAPCRNDDVTVSFTAEGEATFDIDYGRDALNWAMMRGMALWILCQCGVNVVRYKRRVLELRARADAIAALPIETYSRDRHRRRNAAAPASGSIAIQEPEHDGESDGGAAKADQDASPDAISEQHMFQDVGDYEADTTTHPLLIGPKDVEDTPQTNATGANVLDDIAVAISEGLTPSDTQSDQNMTTSMSPPSSSSSPPTQATLGETPINSPDATQRASMATADTEDEEDDEPICAICLEGFEEGQRVRILECTHMYHAACIDPWLTQSSNCCPICKREVPNLPPPPTVLQYGSMSV